MKTVNIKNKKTGIIFSINEFYANEILEDNEKYEIYEPFEKVVYKNEEELNKNTEENNTKTKNKKQKNGK